MELDPAKSVFISYRRQISWQAARLVYRALKEDRGYDVFMDVESLDSGEFGTIIMRQIAARGHFVVILVPGSLDRCDEPNDWLRREIEQAIDLGRNIVPVLFDGFDFTDAAPHLTDKLAKLSGYNAVNVPPDYFEAAMERLHRFLSRPPQGKIQPTPPQDAPIVARKQQEAQTATADADDSERLLSAEEYFNRGKARAGQGDLAGAIEDYTQALRLDPKFAAAYNNRGNARRKQGDLAGAIADFNQALRLDPKLAAAYNNRGLARAGQGDPAGAIEDYTQALQLDPNYAYAYNGRGNARYDQGDLAGAIEDYNQALRLDPNYAYAYNGRGNARYDQGDLAGAIEDYNQALRLDPNYAHAYYNRGLARAGQGDPAGAIEDYERYLELGGGEKHGNRAETERLIRELRKQLKD